MNNTEFFTKIQDRFSMDVLDLVAELKGLVSGSGLWQMSLTARYESALHTIGSPEATAVIVHCEAEIQLTVPMAGSVKMDLDGLRAIADSHGLALTGSPQFIVGEGPFLFFLSVSMKTAWVDGVDGVEVGVDVVQA